MSAAYAAGFRGWPLVIMTAIAGRESGWNNDPPHTDTNGISSTGLWQINSANTSGLTDPLGNAQAAFARAGGNTLGGLSAWALAPPGSTALNGVPQPKVYPWGTVPPVAANDSGYYSNGQFVQHDYSLAPGLVAQALYAYAQLQSFGPATKAELNGSGWGSAGGSTTAAAISPSSPVVASDTSTTGGCSSKPMVIGSVGALGVTAFPGVNACQAKALKGGFLVAVGGATVLFGVALVIIATGISGKGPIAPVASFVTGGRIGNKASKVANSSPSSETIVSEIPDEPPERAAATKATVARKSQSKRSYSLWDSPNPPLRSLKVNSEERAA